MAQVRISRRAALDLEGIERYSTEKWGKEATKAYLEDIEQAIAYLQESPSLLRNKTEISFRFKFYRVRQHFLICEVIKDIIYIVTIKHCSMDLPHRISKLEPSLLREAELLHKALIEIEKKDK